MSLPSVCSSTLLSLENLFQDGIISYSHSICDGSKSKGLRNGTVTDVNGLLVRVLVRDASAERANNEIVGYLLHKQSSFETYFPVTVLRRDGLLVQERVGKSVFDRAYLLDKRSGSRTAMPTLHTWRDRHVNASPSLLHYLNSCSQFRSLMEQAHVERTIFGSFDSRASNFALRVNAGLIDLAVIDLGRAFSSDKRLPPPKIPFFKGLKLLPDTVERVANFVSYLTKEREYIAVLLSEAKWHSMLARANWLLEHKQLPPLEFA